jgi:hypothetical protein
MDCFKKFKIKKLPVPVTLQKLQNPAVLMKDLAVLWPDLLTLP